MQNKVSYRILSGNKSFLILTNESVHQKKTIFAKK